MRLSDFDFDLPTDLIAQRPIDRRDQSRLLVVNRSAGSLESRVFSELPGLLRPGDLLVANQSRVIPARIFGRLPSGGQIELLLIRPHGNSWEAMTRPARKLHVGTVVDCADGVAATVQDVLPEGRRIVRFEGTDDFGRWLDEAGQAPLPPYIKEYPEDPERYQTVYARSEGSVAAPTAGLHFTEELIAELRARAIEMQFITLHVGPGTFKTITEEQLDRVRLEGERTEIPEDVALAIGRAKREQRRVIAVGTTTVRTLEGVAAQFGEVRSWSGEVNLFVRPPFEFHVIDGLITNFHLPKSSLLMLVSALAGQDTIRQAYDYAIQSRYRFYSFGDAMLIL